MILRAVALILQVIGASSSSLSAPSRSTITSCIINPCSMAGRRSDHSSYSRFR